MMQPVYVMKNMHRDRNAAVRVRIRVPNPPINLIKDSINVKKRKKNVTKKRLKCLMVIYRYDGAFSEQ